MTFGLLMLVVLAVQEGSWPFSFDPALEWRRIAVDLVDLTLNTAPTRFRSRAKRPQETIDQTLPDLDERSGWIQ